MDLNTKIELKEDTETELTRVVWWDEERLDEDGVFNFTFNRCSLSSDSTNFALINTETSEKAVLWLKHHPEAKFPDSLTDGEKVLRATIVSHGAEITGMEAITLLNAGGVITYNKSNKRMKWGMTLA